MNDVYLLQGKILVSTNNQPTLPRLFIDDFSQKRKAYLLEIDFSYVLNLTFPQHFQHRNSSSVFFIALPIPYRVHVILQRLQQPKSRQLF